MYTNQNHFYTRTATIRLLVLAVLFNLFPYHKSYSQWAMGEWRTHLSYHQASALTASNNNIYALSEGNLFSVNIEYDEIRTHTKVNGLSGTSIACIKYNKEKDLLLILYKDGLIDIVKPNGITSISDFHNKQMVSTKEVNDIFFYENNAYLSTHFGILELNLTKKEISNTFYIGVNASDVVVLQTLEYDSYLYAISEDSIYKASLSSANLLDYNDWERELPLPGNGKIQAIQSFNGNLYLLRSGNIYVKSNGNWSEAVKTGISDIKVSNGYLLMHSVNQAFRIAADGSEHIINTDFTIRDITYDMSRNQYWIAENDNGLVKLNSDGNFIMSYKPSGPAANSAWDMVFAGDKLFVVPGGREGAQFLRQGVIMILEDGEWTNILNNEITSQTGKPALDFMSVAVNPNDKNHFFVSSYGTGLYEFKENILHAHYTPSNSTLESILNYDENYYTRSDGVTFDAEGNLFVVNSRSNLTIPIKILSHDKQWYQSYYSSSLNMQTLSKIMISTRNTNQKWVLSHRSSPGVLIFDDNGTISDISDDRSIFYSSFFDGDETVAFRYIYSIAQDDNGVVWIGTDKGPFLFYNTENVFNSDYICTRIKVPRNDGTNLADYLLENEAVKAIAIDGANRKWLGTSSSGVYLMSENGQETIHHFTTSNSPLPSNEILSIAINPTGEVFFGTTNGIISYQSDASIPSSNYHNIYAYPNPVRNNYHGPITITGLIENTQIRITDLYGNLVCNTRSNGGIATWDGKDARGRRVNTGVYFVICVNEDGTQSTVTKILFTN